MKARYVTALVVGCLLVLPGVGLFLSGAGLGLGALVQGEDGFIDADLNQLTSAGSAITAEGIVLVVEPDSPDWLLRALSVDTRLEVTSTEGDRAVFIGVAPERDVDAYLDGVAHTEVTGLTGVSPIYLERGGTASVAPPTAQSFWVESQTGTGTQVLDWQVADGQWAAVIMNADGSPGIAADVNVGGRAAFLGPLALILFLLGLLTSGIAVTLIVVGAQGLGRSARTDPEVHPDPVRGVGTGLEAPGTDPAPLAPHPVSVNARLDPHLSRGLWLIKWLLAIPHFIVLTLMWLAFVVLTAVAGVIILFTGSYPRQLFDF